MEHASFSRVAVSSAVISGVAAVPVTIEVVVERGLPMLTIIGMQVLDFLDFLSNSVMMPIAALAICLLVWRVIGFDKMEEEIGRDSAFKRKAIYRFSIKYLAPVSLVAILISSVLSAFGIISI